ncbi:MAG: hypothetical protein ACYC8W_04560 [Candidatus Tyrphobacter sp.]
MKRSILVILGISLAVAGCARGDSSSNQSASTQQPTVAQATAAAQASGLPVYPGATKMAAMANLTVTRCGHKIAVASYDVNASFDTVANWYSARIPGGIRVSRTFPGGLRITQIFEPNGAGVAGVTQTPFAGVTAVHVGLGTYEPALSSAELQTMQQVAGPDSPAKRQALARMSAKCGPASVRGLGSP